MTTCEELAPPANGGRITLGPDGALRMPGRPGLLFIETGLERAIEPGTVTCDLARLMRGEGRADVRGLRCSGFATEIIGDFDGPVRA